jgi:Protein of unknown function (DUF2950)
MPRLLVPEQATSKAPAEANTRFESARLWRFAARSLVGAIEVSRLSPLEKGEDARIMSDTRRAFAGAPTFLSALTAVILVARSSVRASDSRWTFDADGARQEFLARRISGNELNTMGVLSATATAQV